MEKLQTKKNTVGLKACISLEGHSPIWQTIPYRVPIGTFDSDLQLCFFHTEKGIKPITEVNDMLDDIKKKFKSIKMGLEYEKMDYTPDLIFEIFKAPSLPPITMMALIRKTLGEYTISLAEETRRSHKSSAKKIEQYLIHINASKILASRINKEFMRKMEVYYRTEYVPLGNSDSDRLKSTSIEKIFKFFKTVINFGVENELLTKPIKYEIDTSDVDIIYKHLSQNEIKAIETLSNCNVVCDKYCQIMDSFLWMCYTGMSNVDAKQLLHNPGNEIEINEMKVLNGKRQKTKATYNVILNEGAQRLIQKYGGIENIPGFELDEINDGLKVIQKILGFEISLSTKVARESFGQFWYAQTDLPDKFVSKMLGHKKPETKNYYVNIDANDLVNVMGQVNVYK